MTKQQFIKLMGNVDDDIIENYLGTPVDENRPIKLRVTGSRSPFVKYAGIAAAVVCVAAVAIFTSVKLRLPDTPGNIIESNSSYIGESDSSDVSEISSSTNSSESYISNSSAVSSEPNDKIPVEITAEDKELQRILEPIAKGCDHLNTWYGNAAALDNGIPIYEGVTFRFPEVINQYTGETVEETYYRLPKDYMQAEPIPNTYEGIRNDMLEYLTEQYVNETQNFVEKGAMTKEPDGSYSVILEKKDLNWYPKLLEIDSVMYRASGEGGKDVFTGIDVETAKIVSKTEDTIVFTYLWNHWTMEDDDGTPKYLKDIDKYYEHAYTGVLKYERGGWRRASDTHDPYGLMNPPDPEPVDIGDGMTLTGTMLKASDLEEFSLEPYIKNAHFSDADKEFFDSLEIPEITNIYKRCVSLYQRLSTSEFPPAITAVGNDRTPASIRVENVYSNGLGQTYYEWGYTYESFYSAFLSAFTKDAVEEIFDEYKFFLNYDGELFCADTASGGDAFSGSGAWEVHREYELISKSDTVIEFRRTVFRDRDFKFDEQYFPEHRDEYLTDQTDFKFVLTENGWRSATAAQQHLPQ